MGIDAEDGGAGGHGPISVYADVVSSVLANVTNGGNGILVIGGGKAPGDDVTEFWDAIAAATTEPVTYVNGAAVGTVSFSGFAALGVVSSESEASSGGLTVAENDALTARAADVAAFVNNGGGLVGFTQSGFANPYGYLSSVGSFTGNFNTSYSDITPTPQGTAIGITDALDVCCWHDEFTGFPPFLAVLATNASSGNAAALGGVNVVVGADPCDNPTITGTDNRDYIYGSSGNDVIQTGGGDDRVYAGAGDDIICGGDGNDYIDAGSGNDEVYGGAGDDVLLGGSGNDLVSGGSGNDRVAGGSGKDEVLGDDGNDTLTGDTGKKDRCDGGAGTDQLGKSHGCEKVSAVP